MVHPNRKQTQISLKGGALTEYGLLIAMVAVVSFLSLGFLGQSQSGLTKAGADSLASKPVQDMMSLNFGQSSGSAGGGKGFYQLVTDPLTGNPSLVLVESNTGAPVNATSVDGNRMNTLGSLMTASSLDKLAQQEQNPEIAAAFARMAELSYYMGAAEGAFDDIEKFEYDGYRDSDALQDILTYQSELKQLMSSLTSKTGLSEAIPEALALGADTYNIAQMYANAYSQYISNGQVTTDFNTPGYADKEAGSAFSLVDQIVTNPAPFLQDYDELFSYEAVKATAQEVLADNKVESRKVEDTLEGAAGLENIGEENDPS